MKLKERMSWKKNCETKCSKKDDEKENERKKESEKKIESEKKWEKKKKTSFYAKTSDVKSAFYTNQPIFILLYRGACFNTNELDESLSSIVVSLL